MNDLIVTTVASELARRRRAGLLARLAAQRADIVRTKGAAEDSTPYIRRLREGGRADD